MDKAAAKKNIITSMISKVVTLVFNLVTVRILIQCVGNEANGIRALFGSIMGVLTITELGIGSAITFCMYKPIVEGKNDEVVALYCLFKKIYKVISVFVLVMGIIIMPFLPYFASDYTLSNNIYLLYLIVLFTTFTGYLYGANMSLINAYKNDYVATTITLIANVLAFTFEIIVLALFQSFELFLLGKLFSSIVQWLLINIYVTKHHRDIVNKKRNLGEEIKNEVVKKTKAMFMHKMGYMLVNTIDNIIIATFLGVVVLGKYSNYITIIAAMSEFLGMIFVSLVSVVGHLCAKGDVKESKRYFKILHNINIIVGFVFFLGYYAIINQLINIIFGQNLELEKTIIIVLTINYYIRFTRRAAILFRDANGVFYNDRWKPIFEGVSNLILSILLAPSLGIVGIIGATIVTNLLICNTIEPYVICKHIFNEKPTRYYIKNYSFISLFIVAICVLDSILLKMNSIYLEILINGFIAVLLGTVSLIIICIVDSDFKKYLINLLKGLFRKKYVS